MAFFHFVGTAVLTLAATAPLAAQAQELDFSRSGLSAESIAAIQQELTELSKLAPPAEQPVKPAETEKPASLGGAVFSPFSEPATPSVPQRPVVEPARSDGGGTSGLSLTAVTVLATALALTWLLRRA